MLKSIIMNKKWQKAVFIAFSMFYTMYSLLAFTMFKKLPWYKPLRQYGNEHFYHFFAILGVVILIRKFFEYYENVQFHYNIVESVLVFLYEHVLLVIIGLAFYVDYLMMLQNNAGTKTLDVPFLFFYLLCAADFDFEEYLPFVLLASAAFMALTIGCHLSGILPDIVYDRGGGQIGHSLGYIWPLTMHAHFLFIVLLYLAWRKERFSIIEFIILSAANVYLTFYTTAKTGAIIVELALIGALLLHFEKPRELFKRVIGLAYAWLIASPAISFLTGILYQPASQIWVTINAKLNNRPLMQYNALKKYQLSFFGQKIRWKSFGNNHKVTEKQYNFVDNSFMKYSYDYGLLLLVLFIPGFIYATYRFFKKNNYTAIWCIAMIFMFGLFQHQALLITMNPFILSFSSLFMISISDLKKRFSHNEESYE